MDFENKNILIREYFETLNKKKEEMASSGNFTEDEIKDWEDKFFALQYSAEA
ncbi:MAG: hypothetical protein IJ711_06650 [Lachnospiraceae bacterium]|nr:hypothetical protein [Lachnospiraceae bacterium]